MRTDSYRSYGEIKNLYVFDWFRSKWIWWKLVKKIEEYFKKYDFILVNSLRLQKKQNILYKNEYEIVADYEKKYHKNDKYTRRILFAKT